MPVQPIEHDDYYSAMLADDSPLPTPAFASAPREAIGCWHKPVWLRPRRFKRA